MVGPGGVNDLQWCRDYIEHNCIFRSPPDRPLLTSKTTGQAVWQFYLPVATLDPQFVRRVAALFWNRFYTEFKLTPFQLAGCESGGVSLVCALQAAAYRQGVLCPAFMVKKAAKTYGLENWLEGVVDPDRPVILVDDVIGEGKTVIQQAERLQSFGLKVRGVFAIASCKHKVPYTFGTNNIPVTALFDPKTFTKTHQAYVRKYGKPPQFQGSQR
jgi:orotate phosphoribosyltransferase